MLSLGTILQERYRVDRLLEIGALEGRYGGWDLETGRPVLVRELMPQPELDAETLAPLETAFERDAAELAQLTHPHIVRVLDHFCMRAPNDLGSGGRIPNAYLILEATAGQTLAQLIAHDGTVKEAPVLAWAEQLLDALSYAHSKGICHRDIKPEHILILPDNRAMLTDFEILALWNRNDPRTWTAKRVMGTPEYAPPERWGMRTTHIDPRSDVYSLGATLYHALTGEQPLTAGERTSNPYQFLQVKALSPRVSAHTQAAILKAMALPQDRRFQSAQEMAEALRARDEGPNAMGRVQPPAIFLAKPRRTVSWPRVLGLAASTVVLVVAGLIGLQLGDRTRTPSSEADSAVAATAVVAVLATPVGSSGPVAETLAGATPAAATPGPVSATVAATTVTTPTPQPGPTASALSTAPTPPPDWQALIDDSFEDNANEWLVSAYEDDWGTTVREIVEGSYRWTINADQPVGRWCTPELAGDDGTVGDFFVSVEAQRVAGPETAAYGLILRHVEGSYYLFSVRDDGYYQFSLWSGFDWQTMIDWTQTLLVSPGVANKLAVLAQDGGFEFYINDEYVGSAEDSQLTAGEVGLSISTAATDGDAQFVFDQFRLWRP